MCEQDQLGGTGGAGSDGAFAPWATADAAGVTENAVSFPAPGGTMDAFFVHPSEGKHPAVIVWPDIAGLRDSYKAIGRRLAGAGYAVLVVNPFYRSAPAPQFKDFADFAAQGGFQKVGPWMPQNNPANVAETARAVVAWLDQQAAVDSSRGIGTHGYCMGGGFAVRTAAAVPERVKAAASLHGGNGLVADDPTAPVALLPQTQAGYLIAIAQNDDAQQPTHKDELTQAAAAAGRPAEVEVFAADHGWTVPDHPAYNQAEADRAWERLLALYERAL